MGKQTAKKRTTKGVRRTAKRVTKRKAKRAARTVVMPAPVVLQLPKAPEGSLITYKGFDSNLKCRGFQYEVGKSYAHEGQVQRCSSGFHSCEHPLDVFGYYAPYNSRFARVTISGALSREAGGDTKVASAHIAIDAELKIPDLVASAVQFVFDRARWSKSDHVTRRFAAASATGTRGAASATGTRGAASATGTRGAASATGDQGAASATGYQGAASATGDQGAASATGPKSVACGLGYESKARASETGAIVLCHRDGNYNIVHVRASKVGENGIKPNTWYSLDAQGEFIEIAG